LKKPKDLKDIRDLKDLKKKLLVLWVP
jgi:hypothetical protein